MLQGRLTGIAIVGAVALTACTGSRPIEDDVVRPGVSAIEQASSLACTTDAEALQAAIEAYTVFEGDAPPDEDALVATGHLRRPSELWDLVGGDLVPVNPGCGAPPDGPGSPIDAFDALHAELADLTPDEYLATIDDAEIAAVGGPECAREAAGVVLAYARWMLEHRGEPASLQRLVDDGTLPALERWKVRPATLDPMPGSGCVGPVTLIDREPPVADCYTAYRTLEVAVEAYAATYPDAPPPSETDLVDVDLLREPNDLYDLVDGRPVPQAGNRCPATPTPPTDDDPAASVPIEIRTECEEDLLLLESAVRDYTSQFGAPPTAESELAEAGLIPTVRGWHELDASGQVIPVPGGGCD